MRSTTRTLLVSLAAGITGLAALDLAYGRYALRHFGPNVTLDVAEHAGAHCIATIGDSRMAAGIDATVLTSVLRARGRDDCVAPLGVGALPLPGQTMALRRLLKDGHSPNLTVLGVSGGSILPEPGGDPQALSGNRAAELAWSEPSDVFLYYPSFPRDDIDPAIRFSLGRSNALSTYASSAWIKVQGQQDRLTAAAGESRNRFGTLSDMHRLLDGFSADAAARLRTWDSQWRFGTWFQLFRSLIKQSGGTLLVIEVPMPALYRHDILESPVGRRYSTWLKDSLTSEGEGYVDLSSFEGMREDFFEDGVHLGPEGADAFSDAVGKAIVAFEK